MKKINIIPTPIEITYSENFIPFEIKGARIVGEKGEGIIHSLGMFEKKISLSDSENLVIYNGYENFPCEIKTETEELFKKRFAKEQGYYLAKKDEKIVICAYEETGCMYALMTLMQLFYENTLPESFEIKDSPDFRLRANKWLSWTEAGIWSYDRGDGIEKYKERIIRKLDMCLKYKINEIVFDGFGFRSERFPGYNNLMKTLNREARKRKVYLMSSGYTMGYGLSGRGDGAFPGEVHMNRKSYPDGEIYKCIGSYDEGMTYDDILGREYGTCISNDGLMESKLRELTEYIRNVEPGALYLHNMDADDIHEQLWEVRCDECRKRWPNDCLWAEDGAAGAFAYFIKNIYEGIASVKSEDGKYDAKKDCVVYIVSPGYVYMHKRNETYEKSRKFWQKVSELLPDYKNLYIGFREQFFNHDGDNRLRYDMTRDGWKNCDFSAVQFCGGDGFYSDKLFLCGGLFNRLMKSCSGIIIENGNGNQEAMQVCNAEYLWNSENSAFYNIPDMPDNYKEFEPFYINYLKGNTRPEEIYGEEGFLKIICEKLYGKEAGRDFKELFSIHGEDGAPPLTSPCSCEIYTNFTRVIFPMRWDNEDLKQDAEIGFSVNSILNKYIQMDYSTKKAKEISAKIYREKKYFPELEEDVKWLSDNFTICEKFTDMLLRYMQCYKKVNAYFEFGEKIPNETVMNLETLKKEADEFLIEIKNMNLKAIDTLGGALARRDEIADFISYNSEIMLRSITENKRIPSNLRPLKTKTHW